MFNRNKNDDQEIRFVVNDLNFDELKVEDVMDFEMLVAAAAGEEVPFQTRAAVKFLSKFMVDRNGDEVPPKQAFNRIKKMSVTQLSEAIEKFNDAINIVEGKAIPK